MASGLALIVVLAAGVGEPATTGPLSPGPAVLTFTGGASRGAHHAGLAEALLRVRAAVGDAPLLATAGVSVGAVNATLTALLACRDAPDEVPGTSADEVPGTSADAPDEVPGTSAASTTLAVWQAPAWTTLFPFERTCAEARASLDPAWRCDDPAGPAFQAGDGLASLEALAPAERALTYLLSRTDGWRPACRVPVGLGLSAAEPAAVPFAAAPLRSLRTHVFFEVRVVEGRPRFCAPPARPAEVLDPSATVVWLPVAGAVGECRVIDPQDVFATLRAGASFPVHAAPRRVTTCAGPEPSACAPRPYLDGALLEAVPVGLALAAGRLSRPDGGFEVMALDAPRAEPGVPLPDAVVGYAWYKRFLAAFLEVSRYYEAQIVSRYQAATPGHGPVVRVSRLRAASRTYGDFLGGLGAFLHPALRRADFRRGEVAAYVDLLPRLCGAAASPEACGIELLRQTGAYADDELRSVWLATPPAGHPIEAAVRARFVAAGGRADGATAEGCRLAALTSALHAPVRLDDAERGWLALPLVGVFAAATPALAMCADRFPGADLAVRLPDGRPLAEFEAFWLAELRRMTERLRALETAPSPVPEAERLAGYALDVRRVPLEAGWRRGTVPLAERPASNGPLRTLAHLALPVSFGGVVLPDGGLVLHWEHLAYTPRPGLTPIGLGASLRWFYHPDRVDDVLGLGPTVFALWDPRLHLAFSSLGARATLVPDMTEGAGVFDRARLDAELFTRLLGAHLELAIGPTFPVGARADDAVDVRAVLSLCSLNLLVDHLLH
ncbi:hypothetical protein L6V77_01240 [Myxococcota bacterium]|nr:hypothetical protein [Myxococcota bacterium]